MSALRRVMVRLVAASSLFMATVVSTDDASATEPPHGLSGSAGESHGREPEVGASGAMTYGVEFDLPPNRGDAQPSLGLSYTSGARAGAAGWGWSLNVPSIERAPLSGWPKYIDPTSSNEANEDRYTYNGAPVTYVCTVGGSGCLADEAQGPVPPSALFSTTGARYYRRQVEGGFERFFLSSDRQRWLVQRRGGEILELGVAATRPDLQPVPATDVDAATGKIFRWNLAVQRDLHGTNNIVVYQWQHDGGGARKYLRQIYYVPPATGTSTAPASAFAYHVELIWESPTYRQEDRAAADKRPHYKRLKRVAISAKTWENGADRELVRAYNLAYYGVRAVPGTPLQAPLWGRSTLRTVTMEGRCASRVAETGGFLPTVTGCPTLPPTTFEYQPATLASGTATRVDVPGITYVANAAVFDIDRDGLPDIFESWPANAPPPAPGSAYAHYTECSEQYEINALGANESNPRLRCTNNSVFDRSARQQRAWLNRTSAAGSSFQHACVDAGLPTSGGTVMNPQTNGQWGAATRAPSLFSPFGAEVMGSWGDGSLLWSMANHQTFGLLPEVPDNYAPAVFAEVCPEGGGPGSTYPVFAWTRTSTSLDAPSANWSKDRYGYEDPNLRHRGVVDIDGDGLPDLLRDPSGAPLDWGGLRQAEAKLTRRYAANEPTPNALVKGPAEVPFGGPGIATLARQPTFVGYVGHADLNGDGIQDVVVAGLGANAVDVRLGDGRGGFSCNQGTDPSCNVAGNGTFVGQGYRLLFPAGEPRPFPLQEDSPYRVVHPDGSDHRVHFFHDVTGDGLADLIAYTPREAATGPTSVGRIQLWVNTDGRTFRCANVAAGCVVGTVASPDQPTAFHRTAFVDVDGDGTEDFLLVGFHAAWSFSFLVPGSGVGQSAPRPGLLTAIDNGVGARTVVTYKTLRELERAAAALETSFQQPWSKKAPSASSLVTNIVTRDTTTATGGSLPAPYGVYRAKRFEYHDPAYDPWEAALRGFARVRAIEETTQETIQRWYAWSPCEAGPFVSPGCVRGSDGGYAATGAIYSDKPLAGALVRTDRFVLGIAGQTAEQWLSTTTLQYRSDIFIPATADRAVGWAYPFRTDTYVYDPELPVIPYEVIEHPTSLQIAPSQAGEVHTRSETDYDLAGNMKSITRLGRVTGAGSAISNDDKLETRILPTSARCSGNWACRPTSVQTWESLFVPDQPNLGPERLIQSSTFGYDANADVSSVSGDLRAVDGDPLVGLVRNTTLGTGAPPTADTVSGTKVLRTFTRDVFGNITQTLGASAAPSATFKQPCSRTTFDTPFRQLPATITSFAGHACSGTALASQLIFDRGIGEVVISREPNGSLTTFDLDGYGRVSKVYLPVASGVAGQTDVAVEITHTTQAPVSWTKVRRKVGIDQYLESFDLFNGLGEHIMGFDQADTVLDGAPYVLRDWTERDSKGLALATYRSRFYDGAQGDPVGLANAPAMIPQTGNRLRVVRDAFGRVHEQFDGAVQTASIVHKPLAITTRDAEQLKPGGPFETWESAAFFDGHGRMIESRVPGGEGDYLFTKIDYVGGRHPSRIRRSGAWTLRTNERTLRWDSFGRMIENHEPNTDGTGLGWHYVYDLEGRLVGTSDARRCGKNLYYDALGRPVAEDFSPCLAPPAQQAYTGPNLTTGDGTETFYKYDAYETGQMASTASFTERSALALGKLVSVQDRGAHTRLNYDDRGRVRRVSRRLVKPGNTASALASRFASTWFKQESTFDIGDRLTKRTTGLDQPDLLVGGESAETYAYSARGLPKTIGSSYGVLVSQMKYTATGLPTYELYGDAAATRLERAYDSRERLRQLHAHRPAAPAMWSTSTASYSTPDADTTQLDLLHLELDYDDVHNPLTIADTSTSTWRDGARSVSKTYAYDPAYRVKQVDYVHTGGPDPFVSGFHAEANAGDRRPVAERAGGERMQQQRFWYDAHGNVDYSDDNELLSFDRSFGEQRNGWTASAPGGAGGPHQFLEGGTPDAKTEAGYDEAGNMTELTVSRSTCSPTMPDCTHRFFYDWDEVGQLVRARRWDFAPGDVPAYSPAVAPTWDLAYAHGFGGRTLTSKTDSQGTSHTLDLFDTMRVSSVPFNATTGNYVVIDRDETAFIGGVGRVFLDRENLLPQAGSTNIHVYLSVADHLGSTAVVIDKDSGEVVERTNHQAFGKIENDYRPDRWGANREELKFTGKEEDIEVGAMYFGARFYSPHIGRWLSADPLTVHGLGADPNPYAYVGGRVSSFVDPFGLQGCGTAAEEGIDCVEVKGPPRGSSARILENAERHMDTVDAAVRLLTPPGMNAIGDVIRTAPDLAKPGAAKKAARAAGRTAQRRVVQGLLPILCPACMPFVNANDIVPVKPEETEVGGRAGAAITNLAFDVGEIYLGERIVGSSPLAPAAEPAGGPTATGGPGLGDLPSDVGVPIRAGEPLPIPRALSPTEMAALMNTTGWIEFSQTVSSGAASRSLLKVEGGGSTGPEGISGCFDPKGTADEGHCQEEGRAPRVAGAARVRRDARRARDAA